MRNPCITSRSSHAAILLLAMAGLLGGPSLLRAADNKTTENDATKNMKSIAMGAIVDAMDAKTLPEHLAVLVVKGAVDPKYLTDPRGDTKPMTATTEKDWHKITAEVDAHCDFYYVGAVTPDEAGVMIVLYDKGHGASRLVTFSDAHTEKFAPNSPELKAAVKKSNDLPGNPIKLPDTLDGPPAKK